MCGSREGGGEEGRGGGGSGPLKNHKNIGLFRSNTGPDPLKNHKAMKPVFNAGPPLARQRNAIEMTLRWRAAFSGIWFPSSTKKKRKKKVGPPLT